MQTQSLRRVIAVFGAGIIGLHGCGGGGSGGGTTSQPKDTISARLGDMHQALMASPDHLSARADEAVATGDPVKIAQFVRQHIAVLTPLAFELGETSLRFGARGALRAGAGTFRDRAELTAKLLGRAGFTTSIVSAAAGSWGSEVFQPIPAAFQPDVKILEKLGAATGLKLPADLSDDGDTKSRVDAAIAQITQALPASDQTAPASVGTLPSSVPVVEFSKPGGAKSWAIALGTTDVVDSPPAGLGSPSDASSDKLKLSVQVALVPPNGTLTQNAQSLYEVVSGEWNVDELVGRTVSIAFAPTVSFTDAIGADLTGYSMRIPTLELQSLEELPASTTAAHTGNPITIGGALFQPDASGNWVGPFGPVPQPLSSADHASAIAKAKTLEATANPGAFPTIDLGVAVLDGAGQVIDGLGSNDFVVTEEGAPVQPSVLANAPPAQTRVIVLYDTSGSVSDMWPSAQAKTDFETTLSNALVAANAKTPFVVQVVGLGANPSADGWKAPNASDLEASLASIASDSSVWFSVGQVIEQAGASAAILASDCASALEDPAQIPVLQHQLAAAGIPVAVVPIGTPDATAVDTIVSDSGGTKLDPTSPSLATDLESFVGKSVKTRLSNAYRLAYQAPTTGPSTRNVDVSLTGRTDLHAKATYTVPAAGTAVAPAGVAGVYLSITSGGVTDIRRLAGVELSSGGGLTRAATPDDVKASTAVLNGVTDVMIDVPGATRSQRLDDAVLSLASGAGVRNAAKDDKKAIEKGALALRRLPWIGAALGTAPAGADVTPAGVAVRILSTTLSPTGLDLRTDLPPALMTQYGTSSDKAQAFSAALRASVEASVRESQWMKQGAAALLANQALSVAPNSAGLPAWDSATQVAFHPLLARYDSFIRLVPTDGKVVAAWVIDPETGTATAVSADSRGGGSAGCKFQDTKGLAGWLSSAVLFVNLACAAGSDLVSPFQCTGANVYGVGALAMGSFTTPIGGLDPAEVAGAMDMALWLGGGAPTGGVAFCAELMLGLLGQVSCQ